MNKVRASSHEYTHDEKIKNLLGQNFKGTVAHNCQGKRINLTAKIMTSQQKEKHYDKRKKTHDKKNNLTTKIITTTSWQKKKELKCPLGIKEILPRVFLFAVMFSFCCESFSFCREVFLFAVRFFFLP